HWGTTTNRKATGGSQISDFTVVGAGPTGAFNNGSVTFTWSDGTPNMSSTVTTGVGVGNAPNGFSITAPAGPAQHVLELWVSSSGCETTLNAHLSDGSAADYNDTQTGANARWLVYTFTYRAASAGQTLKVTFTDSRDLGGAPNGVGIQDAALK